MRRIAIGFLAAGCMWLLVGCADSGPELPDDGLPNELPFEFSRPADGQAPSVAEVQAFTRKLVGFWARVEYFRWIQRISHGVHASTGKRDYMLWWGGLDTTRTADGVRFYHSDPDGGGHNIMIPTPRVLTSAIAGHLLTGDAEMARVAEQYCKGITATMLGMVYDDADPIDHLMARNIAAFNHEYTFEDGKKKIIDYSGWYTTYEHWNTCRFPYPDNPTWGPLWVTNMRSKDDVPHIFAAVPAITYAASRASDPAAKAACGETLEYLRAFAADIVDSGYRIRSKDESGQVFIPGYSGDPEKDQAAGDLASFVMWEDIIPGAECNAMRAAALIGTGQGQGLDCGEASTNEYEQMGTITHYYNFAIVNHFHLAHLANALVRGDDASARITLQGMAERLDEQFGRADADLPVSRSEWEMDRALLALRAAAYGLPLTGREARLIQQVWGLAADEFSAWTYWDLWSPSVAEGPVSAVPGHSRDDGSGPVFWARVEDMALVLEYCWSPLHNPAGVEFVDCDIVRDPAAWAVAGD